MDEDYSNYFRKKLLFGHKMFYWYRLSIIVILRYKLQFLISFFLNLSVLSSKINVTFGRGLRLISVSKMVPAVFLCTY